MANKYTIFFEIYGKKLKANIIANNVYEAKNKLRDKLTIHNIVLDKKVDDEDTATLKNLKNIFGI